MMWIHKCSRSIAASTNQKIPVPETKLDIIENCSPCLKMYYANEESQHIQHQQIPTWQYLKTKYSLHTAYTPCHTFLNGDSFAYNCVSMTNQNELLWSSDSKDSLSQTMQSNEKSYNSLDSKLISTSEFQAFITFLQHASNIETAGKSSTDEKDCICKFCLNKEIAIKSCVSKAKSYIDEAVRISNAPSTRDYVANMIYIVNLTHLVLIIASLHGLL